MVERKLKFFSMLCSVIGGNVIVEMSLTNRRKQIFPFEIR